MFSVSRSMLTACWRCTSFIWAISTANLACCTMMNSIFCWMLSRTPGILVNSSTVSLALGRGKRVGTTIVSPGFLRIALCLVSIAQQAIDRSLGLILRPVGCSKRRILDSFEKLSTKCNRLLKSTLDYEDADNLVREL